MTEPSELVERLAAFVDPRYSDEFVGNIVRANWPDIHAALSAMPDPSGDVVKFLSDPIFGFLLGENDLNGFWWGDIPPAVQKGKMGQYWWRTNLRHALCRFSALSAVPDPQGNNGQLAANIMARLRGHGIINEDFCAERQDEFEAYILTPMLTDPLAMAKAIEPVLHWYQSDEHEPRPLADILADMVADLQSDRAIAIKTRALVKAADWLSVHAQTSGGTAGSDAKLIEAIHQYGRVRSAIAPATLEVNHATD